MPSLGPSGVNPQVSRGRIGVPQRIDVQVSRPPGKAGMIDPADCAYATVAVIHGDAGKENLDPRPQALRPRFIERSSFTGALITSLLSGSPGERASLARP